VPVTAAAPAPTRTKEPKMPHAAPLLIELGTEELPVKALPGLAAAFADGVVAGLARRGIAHGAARVLYTPRRLAVLVEAVAAEQPEQRNEVPGPYLNVGLDAEGQPTPALRGFAQKNGLAVEQLERATDARGERFVARSVRAGASTAALLPALLPEAVQAMPVPKPMRWGAHEHAFARPLHWLLLLHGDRVVDCELFGIRADRMSRGHRFHHDKPVWIGHPEGYVDALRAAHVLVDADERRRRIVAEVARVADGAQPRIDPGILEEVNCLTEWPVAIACSFERDFLRVPQEALISTMETNQKFFPLLAGDGRLTERFIGIANIDSRDPEQVRRGYERVIRPRFADARFFFEEDLKQGLAAMGDGLSRVTYQQKLGSLADKAARVGGLAEAIAARLGLDPKPAQRAAALSKCDLQSRLVNEFPELQGIAGRVYAAAAGEDPAVATALDEAYQPRHAGDAIAASPLGRLLAVAERLDTLAGGFAAGLKPTCNKDPFALRRAALGLARTLVEGGLELPLPEFLDRAVRAVNADIGRAAPVPLALAEDGERTRDGVELYDFIADRLRGYYHEQGHAAPLFEAVLAVRPPSLVDFDRRLRALAEFAALPEAEALAAANKRIRNILRKQPEPIGEQVEPALLTEPAEIALAESVQAALRETDAALAAGDYIAVLRRLAWLRAPVDAFFDAVMVMAEDPAVRGNRLALLKRLSDRFLAVADVSALSSG
jgi:glycyl-tRNA synthetase beta chain